MPMMVLRNYELTDEMEISALANCITGAQAARATVAEA